MAGEEQEALLELVITVKLFLVETGVRELAAVVVVIQMVLVGLLVVLVELEAVAADLAGKVVLAADKEGEVAQTLAQVEEVVLVQRRT
jgi:hypothetical protein